MLYIKRRYGYLTLLWILQIIMLERNVLLSGHLCLVKLCIFEMMEVHKIIRQMFWIQIKINCLFTKYHLKFHIESIYGLDKK